MDKILMIVAEGIADRPVAGLGGRTPLEAADTPALDRLAAAGEAGGWHPTPEGESPGLSAALRSFFGFRQPLPCGVLAAAGAGLDLREGEAAFRANFVCLKPGATSVVMFDPDGCGMTDEEGSRLVDYLNEHLTADPGEEFRLRSLGGQRALLVYRRDAGGPARGAVEGFTPPHEIRGQPIGDHLPSGEASRRFVHFVNDSQMILAGHPGLREKAKTAMFAANSLWIWGGGLRTGVPPISGRVGGREVAVVSDNPAMAGLARLAGAAWVSPRPGAGDAVREAFRKADFVILTAGGAADASLRGDLEEAVAAIARLDAEVVAPILEDPAGGAPCRILATADAAVSVEAMRRTADPVPYALAEWAAGRLGPPRAPGGLAGVWRRLFGGGEPAAGGFSERLCQERRPLAARRLLGRLLAA